MKKTNGWLNLGTYNRYQMAEFGRFVKKLKDTPEPTGNGNMLDNTLAMHGSASSSFHLSRIIPSFPPAARISASTTAATSSTSICLRTVVCPAPVSSATPGWRGTVKEEDQPLGHLFVSILQRLGVESNTFAGCTGTLNRV